jgi:hypothetical protein
MKQPSQKILVLKHLLRYGSITDKRARDSYGITRLAARVLEIRDDLYLQMAWGVRVRSNSIAFKTRLGRRGAYVKYTIDGNKDELRQAYRRELEAK